MTFLSVTNDNLMMDSRLNSSTTYIHKTMQLALLIALLWFSYQVIQFFITPVLWAAILVYITQPIDRLFSRKLPNRPILTALLLTFLLTFIIVVPLTVGMVLLQSDLSQIIGDLQSHLNAGQLTVPTLLQNTPLIGEALQKIVLQLNHDPKLLSATLGEWLESHLQLGQQVFSSISVNSSIHNDDSSSS